LERGTAAALACEDDMSSIAILRMIVGLSFLVAMYQATLFYLGSAEILLIRFSPFCGAELPESKRDAWFSELQRLGWKDWDDPIPREMLSYDWDAR
jgi:hypothetical protein